MEAGTKSLHEVLSSAKRFIIPEYQRPYVWTREEIEQLWDDLSNAHTEVAPATEEAGDGDVYFLGPLVVANEKDATGAKIAHVVDGQQRVTTLHTLLWTIAIKLHGRTEPDAAEALTNLQRLLTLASGGSTLGVARDDHANFEAIRAGTVLDESTPLGVAGAYLRSRVAEMTVPVLISFANFVFHQTRFVLVQTDSFASAWELFIGLNSKGRHLTPADLIKAFICGTHDDGAAMAGIWESKVLPLGEDATSALLDIYRAATGQRGADATLFKTFEKAWRGHEVDAQRLSIGCDAYFRFWAAPLDDLRLEPAVARGLRCLRVLHRRDMTPMILALATRFGFPAIFQRPLVLALEAYQLWMAITSKRGREPKFAEVAHKILAGGFNESQSWAAIRATLVGLMPAEAEVREAVAQSAYKGRVMLFVVRSYEEGMRGDVRIDDVWYEHIMPQTPTDYWYGVAGTRDPNTYARLVNNIGNIVPLDPATNIKGSNAGWDVKRGLFEREVPNWLAAKIARDHATAWTPGAIRARAQEIAQWAVARRWNLPACLDRWEASPGALPPAASA